MVTGSAEPAKRCVAPPVRNTSGEGFRDVMRHFPTGVTVLTTTGPAGPHGMTANAFMSVSLHPPTVLAAVHRDTVTHGILQSVTGFTVNILAADQTELALLFARSDPEEDPFLQVPWRPSPATGNPVLAQSLAVLDCSLRQRVTVADHTLVIGTATDARIQRPEADPMVFSRRTFQTVTKAPSPG
ncbi:flavin reductase family protein [Streptomyces alfalfae]|uniref:Flavin reductase family protein n=1 Tax=Streptomyces alfalfae TaxID=1642299 RepID=A0A7T4TVH1_9ACTN|nr:flavin reductase family protein [Streptomyces alfalfae]QQC87045.1 flavin reductase family protein [Streptomyces alfalfae]QQC93458.1 flavin reductase family protein [Streptomyces alfalfae]